LLVKRFGDESLVSVFHVALQTDADVHSRRTVVRKYYPLSHTSKYTKREVCIVLLIHFFMFIVFFSDLVRSSGQVEYSLVNSRPRLLETGGHGAQ
jgi:hypothetical protein